MEPCEQTSAHVRRGQLWLRKRDFGYPGGDSCPPEVVRGLARLLLKAQPSTAEERAAWSWCASWVEAGWAMLQQPSAQPLELLIAQAERADAS